MGLPRGITSQSRCGLGSARAGSVLSLADSRQHRSRMQGVRARKIAKARPNLLETALWNNKSLPGRCHEGLARSQHRRLDMLDNSYPREDVMSLQVSKISLVTAILLSVSPMPISAQTGGKEFDEAVAELAKGYNAHFGLALTDDENTKV